MGIDISIRQARLGDAATIARFNLLMAIETEGRKLSPARVGKGVNALLRDPAKGTYYVAECGGRIIGQLLITYEWSDWRNGNFWWIQSVYVEKRTRRRGVFKSLYQHVESLARKDRTICGLRLYVEANNDRAKTTYGSLGMTETHYHIYETDFTLS